MNRFLLSFLIVLTATTEAAADMRGGGLESSGGVAARRAGAQARATPTPTPRPSSSATAPAPTTGGVTATTTATNPSASAVEDCGCEAQPLPDVLAITNGVRITKSDLSEQTQRRVQELRQQVVEARKRELDLIINSKLLEAEARKRGMSGVKLIDQEVVAKVKDPTDAEAQAFYEQNKSRIQGEYKDVKDQIIAYLREERERAEAKRFADTLRAAAQVKVLVTNVTPPATAVDRARVLATVNGESITSGDVEDNLRALIFAVQEQLYTLRNREVELKINDILLQQEAQKRKVTTKALLDTEVATKIPTVTEAQAQTFYNENKDRINGEFAQLKPQIIRYLQEQETAKAETAYAEQLRRGASVQTFLTAPEPPVYQLATDDQPVKGNLSAAVTLVEFTDYQCPSCAQQHPILERLATEYGDRVRFVIRDFPLSMHANAFKAAEAAEAAREQGKYWEYVNLLYRNQSALDVGKLKEYATQLGLDRAKFDAALDSGRFADKVQRDLTDGNRVGVNGTPTLFLNGRRVGDRSYLGLKNSIDAALKAAAAR